jgi:hypothetical protein
VEEAQIIRWAGAGLEAPAIAQELGSHRQVVPLSGEEGSTSQASWGSRAELEPAARLSTEEVRRVSTTRLGEPRELGLGLRLLDPGAAGGIPARAQSRRPVHPPLGVVLPPTNAASLSLIEPWRKGR